MARREASPLPPAALLAAALLSLALLAALMSARASVPGGAAPFAAAPSPSATGAETQRFPLSTLAFEPPLRRGEPFVARGPGYTAVAGPAGWSVALGVRHPGRLRAELLGASADRHGTGVHRQPGRVNYILGRRPAGWRNGVPTYAGVRYAAVYPGIDVLYHGRHGTLEYDFRLAPGADPERIALRLSGARSLRLTAGGDLVARLRGGSVRQHRPVAFQRIGGERRPVTARFALDGRRLTFALGRYDRTRPLVIDPSLAFADYIGGTGADAAQRVALDGSGNVYLVGISASSSIPGATVARSRASGNEAFVLKLSPSGERQWISYVGGSGDDRGFDIGLDSSGRIYITGSTDSPNFPAAGKPTSTNGCSQLDAFVVRLKTNGTLDYARYGGTGDTADTGLGIAVEPNGNVYITDVLQVFDGGCNPTTTVGNVLRYDSGGTFQWYILSATTGIDTFSGIGIEPGCTSNCDIFVAGRSTYSGTGGPYAAAVVFRYTTGPTFGTDVQTVWGPSYYTTTMNPQDPQAPETAGGEAPTALSVDSHGNPAIVGIKTVDSTTHYGFAARFDGQTGAHDPILLTWQTPGALNGSSNAFDIAFDKQDNIYIVGHTTASNDDTTDAVQTYRGSNDAFVVKYFPDGYPGSSHGAAHIVWGTYLGGGAHDYGYGVATDASGGAYVTGETQSSDFIAGPLSQPKSSANDGFLAKIRTRSAEITEGPSGTTLSRDVTFRYSSHETGGSFKCRLVSAGSPAPEFTTCGLQSQAFSTLADGAYTFELKAFDSGNTTNGDVTRREFTVDNAPHARFTIAPNPVLAGSSVTLDASASNDEGHTMTRYEWDLDGDGGFETDGGGTATRAQVYPTPGSVNVGLRVTDGEGRTATATQTLQVNAAGAGGTQFGVTINRGAQFTNKPDVVVTSTFPSFTTSLLFSNDGGFGSAQTFAARKETSWRLDSSGPERLPKTIYVRFLTGSIAGETHQDDIILDETPPVVQQAAVAPAGAGGASAVASVARKGTRKRRYVVRMKARDSNSGVSRVQATANKRRPGKKLRYRRRLTVTSSRRPRWVRARDRAGNWSKWKRARGPRRR